MTKTLGRDHRLPHLPKLLDQDKLGQIFAAYLQNSYPQQAFTLEAITRQKIDYRPQKRCRALFNLQMRDCKGQLQRNWFYGMMHPPGVAQAKFEKVRHKAHMTGTMWQPVSLLPELDMVIWAFPYDPRLAHLPDVANPTVVARQIENQAQALGLRANTKCHSIHTQQIKYAPGKRCVLRFDVELANAPAGQETLSFYSKTYANGDSRYVFNVLQNVDSAAIHGSLEIPRPLLHIDSLHTYWQQTWSGSSPTKRYGVTDISQLMRNAAAVLAGLHRSHLPHLNHAYYIDQIGTEAMEDAIWIGKYLPDDRQRVLDLAERIRELDPTLKLAEGVTAVPIHGAFRLSQLLENGQRLALVDLDDVALGDPHFDVAEFMTSLLYQYFRRDLPLAQLLDNADLFLTTYRSLVPWSCDNRRLAWYIAAFLLEKLYGTLKNMRYQVLSKVDEYFKLIEYFCRVNGRYATTSYTAANKEENMLKHVRI